MAYKQQARFSGLVGAVLSIGAVAGTLSAHAAGTCQTAEPLWADEFSGASLDTGKWDIMIGDGCQYGICGWGNDELQFYQGDNVTLDNGIMKITARKEAVGGKAYTSARIRSTGEIAGGQWTNGRFEARIKIPSGAGLWPAFWMLPTEPDVGWPMSGEIDIMEATGQEDSIAFGTLHFGKHWKERIYISRRITNPTRAWSEDFHVYAVEWEPEEIRWYIDDHLFSTLTPSDLKDPSDWTFENYQYHLLLNLAVGGTLGAEVDDSLLPNAMEVDYVRVYQHGQPALEGTHIVKACTSATYSIVGERGSESHYNWSTPTGQVSDSNMVTVDWKDSGGSVEVEVTNSCGTRNLKLDIAIEQ